MIIFVVFTGWSWTGAWNMRREAAQQAARGHQRHRA